MLVFSDISKKSQFCDNILLNYLYRETYPKRFLGSYFLGQLNFFLKAILVCLQDFLTAQFQHIAQTVAKL